MISTYEDTWQILVSNLIRPADTPRLQTLKVIDDFVRQTKLRDRILDVGCGNNLYKSYYPDWDIYGVDKTFEADTFGFVEDFDLTKFGAKKIIAINSLGYGEPEDVERKILQVYGSLPINGKVLITLNNYPQKEYGNNHPTYDWWENYDFKGIDKVVYHHVKTPKVKADLIDRISNSLKRDEEWQEHKRRTKIKTSDDSYAKDIWTKSVTTDNRYGILRVILQRTK